jgi:hypothetical protein
LSRFKTHCAYHMIMKRREQAAGECSNANDTYPGRKKIWELHAPPVVKIFLWEVCNNLLQLIPTKENLDLPKEDSP